VLAYGNIPEHNTFAGRVTLNLDLPDWLRTIMKERTGCVCLQVNGQREPAPYKGAVGDADALVVQPLESRADSARNPCLVSSRSWAAVQQRCQEVDSRRKYQSDLMILATRTKSEASNLRK
jgi:hypothetical protein